MSLPNTTKSKGSFAFSVNRKVSEKTNDRLTSTDAGALPNGASDNTDVINIALSELSLLPYNVTIDIPANTLFNESLLVIPDNVTILDHTVPGSLKIISNARNVVLPITEGGLILKSSGISGILLRVHDAGATGDPFVDVLNEDTGQRASMKLLNANIAGYEDLSEVATPSAPPVNICRLFARDNGAGKTQLCALFNTGAVQVIVTQP